MVYLDNFPSVNEDNRGVFEILTCTMVAAKRGSLEVKMMDSLYNLAKTHNIDPWDLDQATEMELQVKKAS
jgi:hypothetical protein